MSSLLLKDLIGFLQTLEQTQGELLELFAEKSRALNAFEGEKLGPLSNREGELARRLQIVLGQRNRLLERAKGEGLAVNSLLQLAGAIGTAESGELTARIRRAQDQAVQLRHESWVHWIISHRCYNHYTELLDLIANGGEQAPTYAEQTSPTPATAMRGAILDANV